MEICQKPLYEASFALGEMYKLGCFYFFQNSYFRFHFVIISKLTQTPNNKAEGVGGKPVKKLKHAAAWSHQKINFIEIGLLLNDSPVSR